MRGLAGRLSRTSRERRLRALAGALRAGPQTTILDVGADDVPLAGPGSWPGSNPLERTWPWPERVTALGLGDGSAFRTAFPRCTWVQGDALHLPFPDRAFDIAVANAVIEHVGDRAAQARLVGELCRVADIAVVMTPSRLFPIEVHTLLPFVHWLPQSVYPRLLRAASPARGDGLLLLSPRALRRLAPAAFAVRRSGGAMIATLVLERRDDRQRRLAARSSLP